MSVHGGSRRQDERVFWNLINTGKKQERVKRITKWKFCGSVFFVLFLRCGCKSLFLPLNQDACTSWAVDRGIVGTLGKGYPAFLSQFSTCVAVSRETTREGGSDHSATETLLETTNIFNPWEICNGCSVATGLLDGLLNTGKDVFSSSLFLFLFLLFLAPLLWLS